MEIRTFRQGDYRALVSIHRSLKIIWPESPQTPAAWKEVDQNRPPGVQYKRWVAAVDKRVVGFAAYRHGSMEYPPESYYIRVEVHRDFQGRGIGTALYDCLMDELCKIHPPALRADAFINLPQGFTFLEKRGFKEVFRETPVHLDVHSFDPRPYVKLEGKLKADGIVIHTLRELESDPECYRKLYDVFWEASQDLPTEGDPLKRPPLEEWLEWGVKDPTVLHDAYFIATCGEKYIGLRELGKYGESDVLLGSLLGVRRKFRNRGIGLALQLRGIAYARLHGYRLLKTCTACQNTPMQSLFNKLGFVRDPEWQQCQKDF